MTATHTAPDDLAAYVAGLHHAIDVSEVEAHLDACEACLAAAGREARLEALLREAGRDHIACPGCGRALAADRCDACGAARRAGELALREVLVHNGHGRLYRAVGADGRAVALKELAFIKPPTPDVVAAFEREASYLVSLDHPGIPRFVASFSEGEGIHQRLYLAQEFVAGESLESALRTHRFTEAEVTLVARRVLEILVYLQSLSPMVLHRDLKPANLIRRADGSIALVDFGAAYTVGETVGSTVIGTFGYMPVEQLGGLVDATTDLYALGATLLHLLTRTEPWRLFDRRRVDAQNVSPALRLFLERMTAHDPADRFPSAAAALAALDRPPREVPRWRHGPRRWLAAAGVASVIAAGGATFSYLRHPSGGHEPERPVPVAIAPPPPARPAWARQEPAPGSAWCEQVGETIACTAMSRYRPSRDGARAEAEDAALDALVHEAMVGARNLDAAEIARQEKLQAFDRGDTSAVAGVLDARATVARLARAGRGPAWHPAHDFWWEEYAADGGGSEFVAFVHLETSRADAAAFEAAYAPVAVSGTTLVPLLPTVGWLFDPGVAQAYLVLAVPSGRLRLLGLRSDDILLVDARLPPADLEAAMGGAGLDVLVRRGPSYQSEVRLRVTGPGVDTCNPNDPLCGL